MGSSHRFGDGGHLEVRSGLYEHTAVDGGPGFESRRGGTKDDALEVRTSFEGGLARGCCGQVRPRPV